MVPGYGLKVLMICSQNHFCLLVLHQAGKGISHGLFLDRWKKLLLTDVYALFFYLFAAVFLDEPTPLAEKQPPHVLSQDALLLPRHTTDSGAHVSFSGQSFLLMSQTIRQGIHQRK